jgi:hypothetical protein
VHLAIKQAPLPGAEVRKAYQDQAKRYGEHIASAAILIVGDGFWASAVRAFLTGVGMVDRRIPSKAFADVETLVAWTTSIHNAEKCQPIDPEQLRLALEWMLDQPCVREHREALAATMHSPP